MLEEYLQYDRERRICIYFLSSADIREKEEEVDMPSWCENRSTDATHVGRFRPTNLHSCTLSMMRPWIS